MCDKLSDRDFRIRCGHGNVDRINYFVNGVLNSRPARRTQNNNRDATARQILLVPQIHVCRNKHVEPNRFSSIEQLTVFQCRPVSFESSRDFVLRQRKTERNRRTLIKPERALKRRW